MRQRIAGNPRGPLQELNASERNQILGARDTGLSYGKLATRFNLPRSTIQYTIEHRHDRPGGESQPRSGRPRKLSPGDKRLLKLAFQRDPHITYARLIAENCPESGRLKCTVSSNLSTFTSKWKALKQTLLKQEDANMRYG